MSRRTLALVAMALVLLLLRFFPPPAAQGLASYLPLHTAMETFAIVVSMLVFTIGWTAYSSERAGNIVLLSCAFLAVGLIDFAHALSYKGMPAFVTPSGPEKAINFWLAARFVESGALLAAALLPWRPLARPATRYLFLGGSLALTAAVYWVGLFRAHLLPRTFIEGVGLTPFKIGAEYAIVAVHLGTLAALAVRGRRPQPFDLGNLAAAAGTVILSEICFTLYREVSDAFNLLGHIYKVVAYWFIYRAVFVDSVREPYRRLRETMEERRRAEEARARLSAQVAFLADHDPLTGLLNRRAWEAELSRLLAGGARGAVLLSDLDNFRYVNEAFGHRTGDEVLAAAARLLRERLPAGAVVARLGGDEFAAILPGADGEGARAAAAALVGAARERGPDLQDCTFSVGGVLFPEQGNTAEELLARAEAALARAKADGRNRWQVYSPEAGQPVEAQGFLRRERELRRALEQERLLLYLQPIVDLRRQAMARYEVLLRLLGEDGRVMAPGEFLGVAERFGLMPEVDRWVVRRSLELLARVRAPLCLEVNLSSQSLSDPGLVSFIAAEVARARVNPADLIFEITETAAFGNVAQVQRFLEDLRQLGCRFALDDFGVGFCSFGYLKYLPVDVLKIDGAFVRDLPRSEVDRHLVRAIVEMARGLGKETVAEGVEDAAALMLVRELGVDYAQGFHLGRPVPAREALEGRARRRLSGA